MKHIACCVKDCHLPATLKDLACPMHLAAPELLAALRQYVEYAKESADKPYFSERIERLIGKADI